jgi:hypothetical protein
MRAGDHAAYVYRSPEDLLERVVPYLRDGLAAGDKVVYVADDLDVTVVNAALREAGVDPEAEATAGRLVVTSALDAFFAGGRFDPDEAIAGVRALLAQARADGFKRVRFSVEMTYLLRNVPGIERGVEFEARVNEEVFASEPILCICAFNETRDDGRVLLDVLRTHQVLLEEGGVRDNPGYVRGPLAWRNRESRGFR